MEGFNRKLSNSPEKPILSSDTVTRSSSEPDLFENLDISTSNTKETTESKYNNDEHNVDAFSTTIIGTDELPIIFEDSASSDQAENHSVLDFIKTWRIFQSDKTSKNCIDAIGMSKHGYWRDRKHFLLSLTGYVVGLGNAWRFPYLLFNHGGAAFFIPYFVMLFFIGFPIFYMEVALGQFSSKAIFRVFDCVPLLKGLSITFLIISNLQMLTYVMELTYVFHYLLDSFACPFPWTVCHREFHLCKTEDEIINQTHLPDFPKHNCSTHTTTVNCNNSLEVAEFYLNQGVFNISSGISSTGQVQRTLLWQLFVMWLAMCIYTRKGIRSVEKINYLITSFPFVALTIILSYGLQLDGAIEGINYFLLPKWKILGDALVWKDAAEQVVFSLSLCLGGLTTLSSYNEFHNNCLKDCFIVICIDLLSSVYAGITLFAILGYVIKRNKFNTSDIVKSGRGLAFIAYPHGIGASNGERVYLILFFTMLIIIGLESMFGSFELVVRAVEDMLDVFLIGKQKFILNVIICTACFLPSIIFTTQAGVYWKGLLSLYVESGMATFLAAVLEVLAIGQLYGARKFGEDIEMMHGKKPTFLILMLWAYITPAMLCVLSVIRYYQYKSLSHSADSSFTWWADVIGWFLLISSLICIPAWAVHEVNIREGTLLERVRNAIRPNEFWRPLLDKHCTGKYTTLVKNIGDNAHRVSGRVFEDVGHTSI